MQGAKQKLINILSGWKNYVFENEEVETMAKNRAVHCATCENAEYGFVQSLINDEIKDIKGMICNKCDCPLSAKLRSPNENCPKGLWQAK